MEIVTSQFGKIEYQPELVIKFESGIIGFENLKNYVLLKASDDDYIYWLNSVDEPDIAFPLFGLRIIDNNYPMQNNEEAFGIVTLNQDPLKITINLRAPVYLDQEKKKGFQKILEDDSYPVSYNLFKED